jgi:hypothetical protein
MDLISAYHCWIPPVNEDDEDADFFPEFCQESGPSSEGPPYTVWITFKEGLSVEVMTIYYEATPKAAMIELVHSLFADNSDIIHRVEVQNDSEDSNWCISVESFSHCEH